MTPTLACLVLLGVLWIAAVASWCADTPDPRTVVDVILDAPTASAADEAALA